MERNRRNKYSEEHYGEVIDVKDQEKKKWIKILVFILIIVGLVLLNYLKIDQNGRIYWERKPKIEKQEQDIYV